MADGYHEDSRCGSCGGPLEDHRDAVCETCVPQSEYFRLCNAAMDVREVLRLDGVPPCRRPKTAR